MMLKLFKYSYEYYQSRNHLKKGRNLIIFKNVKLFY